MKNLKFYPLFVLTILILNSCDDVLDPENSENIPEQLEGSWKCDESSSLYKSTAAWYSVYLTPSETNASAITISNFYDLGNDTEASTTVNGNTITIGQQEIKGGYTVRGSGTISSNLKTITWVYYVDDGSGVEDEIRSTYTYQY